MAEYSERTGVVKWQRVVVASQREQIEKWLGERYPVQGKKPAVAVASRTPAAEVTPPRPAGRKAARGSA